MRPRLGLIRALALIAAVCGNSTAGAANWTFALIGDTPYSARERAQLPQLLERIGEANVAFVAHIGDIKNGSERCDDALFADRHRLFDASPAPFVFIPGDNEWSDCHRVSNGSYDPLERLEALRRLFWATQWSLGQRKIKVQRQSAAYPEHARFRVGPALFVTLNIPGGDNNYGPGEQAGREFMQRNPAVLAWIRDSFAQARREALRGVVLLFQADPDFSHYSQGFPNRGYRELLDTIYEETRRFRGEVVAVHGDTHIQRIDHPLRDRSGRMLKNFTRVETFGSPFNGWILGEIDEDSPRLFRFEARSLP